jgi:hypothetical protein
MPKLTTPIQSTPEPEQRKAKLRYQAPALVHLGNTPDGQGGTPAACDDGGAAEQECVNGPNHASV